MNLRKKARQLPLRLAAGSFVISSGLSIWGADEATAKHLEGFAAGTYPFLAKLDPRLFAKALSASELAIGAAVLLPFVPAGVAGAALTVFSAGLIGLTYARQACAARGVCDPPSRASAGQGRVVGRHRNVPDH
ncbi:MAG: hypothetical protein WAN20_05970 [Pseudonocardiaceae bacterium]